MEDGLDLGSLGFWLFLASVAVALIIAGAMKHRAMLRLIETSIEKTGTVDPRLAELLEREIARQEHKDARMWGVPHGGRGSERKTIAVALACFGSFFGFIIFAIIISQYVRDGARLADESLIGGLLFAIGIGVSIAGAFGLLAWLIWPKAKKTSQDEPLV